MIHVSSKIRQSEAYPRYFLISRDKELHVAIRCPDGEDGDPGIFKYDGWISCGVICHEENFESACDAAEEEFRCMMGEFIL